MRCPFAGCQTVLKSGSQWFTEIKTALTNTKVAALLITPDFLASDQTSSMSTNSDRC